MKKILFVNPADEGGMMWNVLRFPPLGLATLAAHTPDNYDMKIIDENVSKIDFNEDVDLVAITSMTHVVPRGYNITKEFKKRGVSVVMGGIHPTMLPNEAIKYCDSVVIGEAESIWPQLIQDFENKRLRRFYHGKRIDLVNQPIPRRDLFEKKYPTQTIQTSRGCPFNCEYCTVTQFSGGTYRQRPINEVIKELETIKDKKFMFADDNIVGVGKKAEERAISLFNEVKELGKIWGSQAPISIADNDRVLKAATDSGCGGFYIGIESINELTLKQMGKGINLKTGVKNYKEKIKKLHDYGFAILGAFVFGNDFDDKDTIKRTVDFILDAEIDRCQLSISTPFPGTRLFDRLNREGRILYKNYPEDWKRYGFFNCVFKPKNMTLEELENGVLNAYEELTSIGVSFKRAFKTFIHTKRLLSTVYTYLYNRRFHKSANLIYAMKHT